MKCPFCKSRMSRAATRYTVQQGRLVMSDALYVCRCGAKVLELDDNKERMQRELLDARLTGRERKPIDFADIGAQHLNEDLL